MRAKLTKRAVDDAKPAAKEYLVHDTLLSGFSLKVTPKGSKSYFYQYRIGGRAGRTRRITIGTHGSPWTPEKARAEAEKHAIAVKQGHDPQERRQEQRRDAVSLAFDKYAEFFIATCLEEKWPRFKKEGARLLRREAIPYFGAKPLPSITKRDVTGFFDTLKKRPGIANNTSSVLSRLFRWAEDRGELPASPMYRMERPKSPEARERFLNDEELAALWTATLAINHPYCAMVRTLILIGQRRDEVAEMRWEEIDLSSATWKIPANRTKNKKAHLVPLSPMVIAELEATLFRQGWVFSVSGDKPMQNWSYWKRKIDPLFEAALSERSGEKTKPQGWVLHDLRRSVASGLQRRGHDRNVIEVLQNRALPGATANIYQRHDYLHEKRIAIIDWAQHVSEITSS